MAGLTIVKNPFVPHRGRITHAVCPNTTVGEVIDTHLPVGMPWRVFVDGVEVTDRTTVLREGQECSVCAVVAGGGGGGGGKNVLRTVALIAVVALATVYGGPMGVAMGQTLLGGTIAAGTTAATFWGAIGTATIMVGGSLLINTIMPPPKPEMGAFSLDQSNTYGWDPAVNQIDEGLALPVLYGTRLVTPQIISRYRTTDGTSEQLNLLMAISDGEITSITNVRANDVDITTIPGAIVSTRLGTPTQTVVPGFQDTIFEKVVGAIVEDGSPVTVTTDGNSVESLGVGLVFQQGLFSYTNGAYGPLSVTVQIEYSITGLNSWTSFSTTITNDSAGPFRFYQPLGSYITAQTYDVRVTIATPALASDSVTLRQSTMYIEYIHEVTTDDFTYPGVALLGITAVASEQIYGATPSINCLATRSTVYQYATTWGTGTPTSRPANNPAWICYDMLVNPLYGMGVPLDRIEIQNFIDWADFCTTKGHVCNIYLDQTQSLYDGLNMVSEIGRGSVVQRGTTFGAMWDDTGTRVHLYTPGNIITDSYNMVYLDKDSRANIVEVTYFDEALDYERKVVNVLDTNATDLDVERKSSIVLYGCTNRDQAARHGKFLLNSNKYLRRVVTFDTDIDSIVCEVGDIIGFAHDVPRYGEGGRIVSATAGGAVLSREVSFETGKTYVVIAKNPADNVLQTRGVVNPGTSTTATITLSSNWATTPAKDWVYSFGETNKEVKDFRVVAISRSGELKATITAMEYRSEVYSDSVTIPTYEQESNLPDLTALVLDDVYEVQADGTYIGKIYATWRGYTTYWTYSVVDDTGRSVAQGTTDRRDVTIGGVQEGKTYTVSVKAAYGGTELTSSVTMIVDPPEAPTGLSITTLSEFVTLRWNVAVSEIPVATYQILKGADLATAIAIGSADKTFTTFLEPVTGTFTYWVRAIDRSGRIGAAASVTANIKVSDDYRTLADLEFTGGATTTNVSVEAVSGDLIIPNEDSTTWEAWWDATGYTTWQEFIDDGYLQYLAPSLNTTLTSSIEQVFDLGGLITQGIIDTSCEVVNYYGNPAGLTIIPTISYSANGVDYVNVTSVFQVPASLFRYVKVKLTMTRLDTASIYVVNPTLRVVAKKLTDSGVATINVANSGVVVNLTGSFAKVTGVAITPLGDVDAYGQSTDISGVSFPTSFTGYLRSGGTKINGTFAYTVTGY
jgi:predicted phage tail protein